MLRPNGLQVSGHALNLIVEFAIGFGVVGLVHFTAEPCAQQFCLMAWKTAHIDRWRSHTTQQIHLDPPNWAANPVYRRSNFSQGIQWLHQNMPSVLNQLNANPQLNASLLNKLLPQKHLPGFSWTYRLTLLFFITRGNQPIYDQFAHKAALAIDQDLPPWTDFGMLGSKIYMPVSSWKGYDKFKQLLRTIKLQPSGGMFISRDDDRALWVYGHLFKG